MANRKLNENWDQKIYDKYHALACKIARSYTRKYNLPYEDMKAEAEYHLASLILRGKFKTLYDPTKGAGSTWIYKKIYWALKDYIIALTKVPTINFTTTYTDSAKIIDLKPGPSWVEKLLTEVSEEAQFIIKAIISAPIELLENENERKCRRWIKDMRSMDIEKAKNLIEEYVTGSDNPYMLKWKYKHVSKEIVSCL